MKKHTTKPDKKDLRMLFVCIVNVFFLAASVGILGMTVYLSVIGFLPALYIVLLSLLCVILIGFHVLLLTRKTAVKATQIISLVVSVVTLSVYMYASIMFGTLHGAISNIPIDNDLNTSTVTKDVSKEPFIVYISGIDARNISAIHDKSLSDVNMIVVVNPNTHKILMVNTPRDYYVGLKGDPNKLDKLTHAGSYGIDWSMQTLASLYDIDINYYIKVNFKSVVDIVNAVGGITVNSEYSFSSDASLSETRYYFKKGENTLNGDQALAFVRERYTLPGGDRQRGINQQKVIGAVIDKAISPYILNSSNLKSLLDSFISNMKTNISYSEISDLIKMQLSKMPSWDIETVSVDGTGATKTTYSSGSQALYVMIPNQDSVDAAKDAINEVLNP